MDIELLPQEIKDSLKRIISKAEEELNDFDKELLRARRDYLKPEQLAKFPTVLGNVVATIKSGGKKRNTPQQPAGTQYTDPEVTPPVTLQTQPVRAETTQPVATPPVERVNIQTVDQTTTPSHEQLLAEVKSLQIILEGNETDEQIGELIAAAKEEDLSKATVLGIDTTDMSAEQILQAVLTKEQENEAEKESKEQEENPYGAGNADPDQK